MRVLITAGPTHEPIDAVRYIGNRSSGQMGSALARAAIEAGHQVTLILGPVTIALPQVTSRIDVQTARQMHEAVLREFPHHELLIMAAAVADYAPVSTSNEKLERGSALTIRCEPTEDIAAAAGRIKRADQRTVGFSLEARGNLARSAAKLAAKKLDLIVYNPIDTMESSTIEAVLLWPNGQTEELSARPKSEFAKVLIDRATRLFSDEPGDA